VGLFDGKRLAAVATMTAGLLLAGPPAHAWYVDISITGAGRVYETTDANELDEHCPDAVEGFVSPSTTPSGTLGASCRAGDASGDYGSGWVVRYVAEPAAGYRFAGWRSDGRSTPSPVLCDGSNGSPDYGGAACQFATWANLQTRAVFVDDTAPSMASLSGPTGQVNGSATFTFSAAADPTFKHFQCRLVDGAESQLHDWQTCSPGHQEDPAPAGTERGYKLYVRAVDRSDNPSPPSSWSWTADKLAPETTLDSGSGPSGLTTSRSATFNFSGSGDVTGYTCTLDGVAAACASPQAYSDLADGAHTFQVWARDDAGNRDLSPATRTWSVDTVAPGTTITGGPAAGSTSPSQTASFTFTSTESGTLECQLDGTGWSVCESPRSYTGLGEGAHTFAVRARDAAGNVDGSPATRTWSVVSLPATMDVRSQFRYRVSGGRTTVRSLKLTRLPARATVKLSCQGRGCAFRAKTLRPGTSSVTLTRHFKNRKLSAGTVIRMRVTAAGYEPKTFRYQTRGGSRAPIGGEVARQHHLIRIPPRLAAF
jgi:hypothetical protein